MNKNQAIGLIILVVLVFMIGTIVLNKMNNENILNLSGEAVSVDSGTRLVNDKYEVNIIDEDLFTNLSINTKKKLGNIEITYDENEFALDKTKSTISNASYLNTNDGKNKVVIIDVDPDEKYVYSFEKKLGHKMIINENIIIN